MDKKIMMRTLKRSLAVTALAAGLLGCSAVPSGPSALALQGHQSSEPQFRTDEKNCRSFAHRELASTANKPKSPEEAQLHFDINYLQCMYGRGHLIPVSGELLSDPAANAPPTQARP